MKLAFRPVTSADDQRFVVSTWSSSYKTSYAAGLIQSEDWPRIMHEQIPKVLAKPGTRTIVAFEKSDPAFLYGFVCGDTTDARQHVVHYCYVKETFRRLAVARSLFRELGVDPSQPFVYTCKTPAVTHVHDKLNPRAKFNPNVARFPPKETR